MEIPDSVNSIILTNEGGDGSSIVAGGIIGNCINQGQRIVWRTDALTQLNVTSASDMTICGWAKPLTHGSGSTQSAFSIDVFGLDTSSEFFAIVRFDLQRIEELSIYNNSDSQTSGPFDDSGISLVGGDWFHWLLEVRSGILGMQINNGDLHIANSTPILFDTDSAMTLSVETNALGDNLGHAQRYDEWGIFKAALTDTQKAYIYNSGVGRTWPFTLPP